MNNSSKISSTRKNRRTGRRCFAGLAGRDALGPPAVPPGPRGGPDGGMPGRGCGVWWVGVRGYGARLCCESGVAGPYGSGITRVRSGSACWGSRPYSQSRSSSRPGDMSAKVPGRSPARRRGFSVQGAGTQHTGRACGLSLSKPECPSTSSGHMNDELNPHVLSFLPRQQTERLPRCQFAPRMLHRARRPRCPHVSSEANASRDAEAWPFWP